MEGLCKVKASGLGNWFCAVTFDLSTNFFFRLLDVVTNDKIEVKKKNLIIQELWSLIDITVLLVDPAKLHLSHKNKDRCYSFC